MYPDLVYHHQSFLLAGLPAQLYNFNIISSEITHIKMNTGESEMGFQLMPQANWQ